MVRLKLVLFVVPLILGSACNHHDHYEIRLRPDGDRLHRELTCWRVSQSSDREFDDFNEDHLREIARIYGGDIQKPLAAKHSFQATFGPEMPHDLGSGYGSFMVHRTSLGTVCSYQERFAGEDDLVSQLEGRREKIDTELNHLVGWIDEEVAAGPEVAKLRELVDVDFRRDLHNVSLYVWSAQPRLADSERTDPAGNELDLLLSDETGMRLVSYFGQRGYFGPGEVSALLRNGVEQDDAAGLFRRLVLRKLGYSDVSDLPSALGFLADPERAEASWAKYCRKHPDELGQGDLGADDADSESWKPTRLSDHVGELLATAIGFQLFQDTMELHLTLETPVRPFATNGTWSADDGVVRWSGTVVDNDDGWPTYCFAHWSTPNQDAQQRHFGKVILDGHDLQKYAFWLESLRPNETEEWERFVERLAPDETLRASIEAFRFESEQDLPEDQRRWSATGRDLLLRGLPPQETRQRGEPR